MDGALINQTPVTVIADNPLLKTEKHNRTRLDADNCNDYHNGYMSSFAGAGRNVDDILVADKVEDLIIFNRAHGQGDTTPKGGGTITCNVDARLFTAQAYARYSFSPYWVAGIRATYNHGHNKADGRPLCQIRPFKAVVQADYRNYFAYGSCNIGITTRFVVKRTRGDLGAASDLSIDGREATEGFTVADLYAGVNIKDKYGLRLGVNNVLNKKYAEYIGDDHALALLPSVVYTSGRTRWLSLYAAL